MERELVPVECTVFYAFLHLDCLLPQQERRPLEIFLTRISREEDAAHQAITISRVPDAGGYRFVLEAMIDRTAFPDDYALRIVERNEISVITLREIVDLEQEMYARSMMGEFHQLLNLWLAAHPGVRPRLLDIGGRARSGYRHAEVFDQCDITIIDIIADDSVDVVADIHRMSETLGTAQFEFAICISVFEHLVMPWKAALEINKVLCQDGIILITTHQTTGMHDMPWDYYRFSDESWKGMFNGQTGFAIERTLMSSFQRIVPQHYYATFPGFENAGGFAESSVIARKTGVTTLIWPVDLATVVQTTYPA